MNKRLYRCAAITKAVSVRFLSHSAALERHKNLRGSEGQQFLEQRTPPDRRGGITRRCGRNAAGAKVMQWQGRRKGGNTDKEFSVRTDPVVAGYPFARNPEARLPPSPPSLSLAFSLSGNELTLEIHGADPGRRARYILALRSTMRPEGRIAAGRLGLPRSNKWRNYVPDLAISFFLFRQSLITPGYARKGPRMGYFGVLCNQKLKTLGK